MTLNRLVWDNLLELDNVSSEVVSMTIVLKNEDGTLEAYGVNEYGSFYKVEQ